MARRPDCSASSLTSPGPHFTKVQFPLPACLIERVELELYTTVKMYKVYSDEWEWMDGEL